MAYSLPDVLEALRNADAAGNVEDAEVEDCGALGGGEVASGCV
jgi:hypothetical protein